CAIGYYGSSFFYYAMDYW
nr:immunoglobulin heavy chain junction region [Mus musculus]MBK4186492.1 immunoglobulin heavy chain junction region [Mus musculus]